MDTVDTAGTADYRYSLSPDEQAAGLTENEALALRHRRKGFTYARIGAYLGVSSRDACRLAHDAKRKLTAAYPSLWLVI